MQRVLFHKVLKDIPKQDGSYSLLVWQGAGVANNMATWMVRGVKNRGWGRKYSEAFLFKILIPASVSGEENLTPLCFSGGKKNSEDHKCSCCMLHPLFPSSTKLFHLRRSIFV